MKNFNDEKTFINDMIEVLIVLIQDKLKATIEFSLETHNANALKSILKILDEFKF